jgi:hypothetical protein
MLCRHKSLFRRSVTERRAINQIHRYLATLYGSSDFAKEYFGVDVFQKRQDLRSAFAKAIESEMRRILMAGNPYRELRVKILKTIKVSVVNSILLREEFEHSRDSVCEAINLFLRNSMKNHALVPGMEYVRDEERFSDQDWSYAKIVHEAAWAEVEWLVLRHVEITFFDRVSTSPDWWDLYRGAFEEYVLKFYRLMIGGTDIANGIPHPLLAARDQDYLTRLEAFALYQPTEK